MRMRYIRSKNGHLSIRSKDEYITVSVYNKRERKCTYARYIQSKAILGFASFIARRRYKLRRLPFIPITNNPSK